MPNGIVSRSLLVLWVILLLIVIVFGALIYVQLPSPPSAEEILEHPIPLDATVLGTYQMKRGPDGLNMAVIEMNKATFEEFVNELELEICDPSRAPTKFGVQQETKWWDPPNLAGTPTYIRTRIERNGSKRRLYVKYENGRMYIVGQFYQKQKP